MGFSLAFLAGVLAVLLAPAVVSSWAAASIVIGLIALAAASALPGAAAALTSRVLGSINRSDDGEREGADPLNRTCMGLVMCGLAVGYLITWHQATSYLSTRWPPAKGDDRVIATVVIDSIPVVKGDTRFFEGMVTVERPAPLSHPLRVRITSRATEVTPHAGDTWRLLLKLRPPKGRVNPGAPDAERIYFRDRVHALGTVISTTLNQRIDTGHRPLDQIRERIARHIGRTVSDPDASALIQALAVGVTGSMSREQWRIFNATGTTHLVAISGMHVTLFAVLAFAASRALWSAVLYRFVSWRRENFAAVVGFTAAALYATLAGLSVPTQRTLIMLGAWLSVRAVARQSPPFHSFALSLVLVLALDPFAPLAAGFWLSFVAMAVIILVTSTRFTPRSALGEALAIQAMVTVALTPLTLAAFSSVSLIGPLVNLLAIPAMSWVLVPTILFAVTLSPISTAASDAVLHAAAWLHDYGWPWFAAAADVSWALAHTSPPVWWYFLAAPAVLLSLMPWPPSLRLALVLWLVPLAAASEPSPDEGAADITMLDVGDGTSVVIQTAHHTLVYDTGEVYGSEGRVTESVLIPVLRSRGIRKIDALVLSRLNGVTAPGVTALLAEYEVAETLVGDPPPDLPGARDCSGSTEWQWDGVHFQAGGTNPCVLVLEAGGTRWSVGTERRGSADQGAVRLRIGPTGAIDGPNTARAQSRRPWRASP